MDNEILRSMRKAIKDGDLHLIEKMLEEHKGLLDEVTGFGTWLHVAAEQDQVQIVKFLIEKGINIDTNGGFADCSAICEAAFSGHINMVKYLYENGAKLDESGARKNPLFAAIYNGHFEIAKFFIDNGIDIRATYPIGQLENVDACEYARQYGRKEIQEYLMEKLGRK